MEKFYSYKAIEEALMAKHEKLKDEYDTWKAKTKEIDNDYQTRLKELLDTMLNIRSQNNKTETIESQDGTKQI